VLPQPTASPLPRERASRLRPEPARPRPCSAQTPTTARRPPLAALRSPPSSVRSGEMEKMKLVNNKEVGSTFRGYIDVGAGHFLKDDKVTSTNCHIKLAYGVTKNKSSTVSLRLTFSDEICYFFVTLYTMTTNIFPSHYITLHDKNRTRHKGICHKKKDFL
jgi:hypothetical protein